MKNSGEEIGCVLQKIVNFVDVLKKQEGAYGETI